jgi:hypothetical protein
MRCACGGEGRGCGDDFLGLVDVGYGMWLLNRGCLMQIWYGKPSLWEYWMSIYCSFPVILYRYKIS